MLCIQFYDFRIIYSGKITILIIYIYWLIIDMKLHQGYIAVNELVVKLLQTCRNQRHPTEFVQVIGPPSCEILHTSVVTLLS